MKRTLLLLVLCSVCQVVPETPHKDSENIKTSLIECDEEKSEKSGNSGILGWFNKGRDLLLGKERCVCCCQDQNKEIIQLAVRDVSSEDDKQVACKSCRKGLRKSGECIIGTTCCCGWVFTSVGQFFKTLALGVIGCVMSACDNHIFSHCKFRRTDSVKRTKTIENAGSVERQKTLES